MNIDIKLHNGDLPDQLTLSDNISGLRIYGTKCREINYV